MVMVLWISGAVEEFCIGIPRVETNSLCARVITKRETL